ncbi:ribosomal protein S18-alanine N-acetyltransferase [uncultured Sphingomonas sp.]|uniref:ribosomal protein S18-alanine N-acetyltransferase n=1 Tax=uncultured Sphingomonas sp. TaxID=158754 RepID=UPI0025E05F62|nr:ribosomal protein S18-alanine N-acetyltransferase [uncultured Sphingomonas sp.]
MNAAAPQPIELREGGVQDLPSVCRIMQAAFDPAFGEAWTQPQCMGMMALTGVWLLVASIDGRDCGFAMARAMLDEAELLLLATDPGAQGRGVGGALLRAVIAESRNRRATKLHLEVRQGNAAIRLYHRVGFEKAGERRGYYRGTNGQTFNALTLARALG